MAMRTTGSLSRRQVVAGAAAIVATPTAAPVTVVAQSPVAAAIAVPPAPRDGTVELLHGIPIADPFRPLEDPTRADVCAWIDARAGHGGGNAYAKSIEYAADVVTFLTRRLGGPVEELPSL